jgi:hypothetical protein
MKSVINKQIAILFLILFTISNALSCRHQSHYDGKDYLGFPFNYFTYFAGKCENCYDENGFKILMFLLDVVIVWFASILILYIIGLIRNSSKKR